MDKVISRDGTPIAYLKRGTGTPLVLVHGTSSSYDRWQAVLPYFEQRYTVYAIERRGRGESGDSPDYAIDREFEDLAALVDAIPEPVILLGHSYGGICALEAMLRTANVKALLLYEPAVALEGVEAHAPEVVEKLLKLQEKEDREGILAVFTQEVLRMSPEDFIRWRTDPVWVTRLATALTIPREVQSRARYVFDACRFGAIDVPTMLLMGTRSPAFLQLATKAVHAALPTSELVVMDNQGHVAMDSAPRLFAETTLDFLSKIGSD